MPFFLFVSEVISRPSHGCWPLLAQHTAQVSWDNELVPGAVRVLREAFQISESVLYTPPSMIFTQITSSCV